MTNNEEPQWLDPEERIAWIGLMTVLTTLPGALDRQLRADSGLTHFDYQVMVILSETPDRTLRMSQLAESTGGSLPRLSQVVGRLEKPGWVQRRPDPDDGRSTLATLTDEGFQVLATAAPQHVAEVRRLIFDPLTRAQVGQLARITDRILQGPGSGPDPRPKDARNVPSHEHQTSNFTNNE